MIASKPQEEDFKVLIYTGIMDEMQKLKDLVASAQIPDELRLRIDEMLLRSGDYEQKSHYIDWVINLPWSTTTKDILDLQHTKMILDQHHYGLEDLKQRFLEYLSVLILNEQKSDTNYHAPILLLVGLAGTGKTTFAKSIAEGLGRKFVRIPFGGMGSALDLRGQSRVRPDAEVGQIIKAVRRAGSRNPIILLDEIDRVSEAARSDIMGVLIELLDPEQNMAFIDHYIDYPFDLSQVLFIATCNNTTNISTAVMDRLEPIMMPSYSDEEKIHIARDYVLPREVKNAGLPLNALKIDEAVWAKITRPLGFDAGLRTLERTVQGMVRKVAKMMVEGKGSEFYVNQDNLKQFLPTY